jgi:hypothetical protein
MSSAVESWRWPEVALWAESSCDPTMKMSQGASVATVPRTVCANVQGV